MEFNCDRDKIDSWIASVKKVNPDWHPLDHMSFSTDPESQDFETAYDLGMIRKENLVVGAYYKGNCRNASVARWDGEHFTYNRTKWTSVFPETIKYPTDEMYFDVFVPYQLVEPTEFEIIKE